MSRMNIRKFFTFSVAAVLTAVLVACSTGAPTRNRERLAEDIEKVGAPITSVEVSPLESGIGSHSIDITVHISETTVSEQLLKDVLVAAKKSGDLAYSRAFLSFRDSTGEEITIATQALNIGVPEKRVYKDEVIEWFKYETLVEIVDSLT